MGNAFNKKKEATPQFPKGDIFDAPSGNLIQKRAFTFDRPKLFCESDISRPPNKNLTPYTPGFSIPSSFPPSSIARSVQNTQTTGSVSYPSSLSQASASTSSSLEPNRAVAITPSSSNHSYSIWTNSYYKHRIKPEDWSNYNTRISNNVDEMLKDSEAKLRLIRQQIARLEASQVAEKEVQTPSASVESYVDLGQRYSLLKFLDKKFFSPKPERPVLTDEILSAVKDASQPNPPNQTLVEVDGVQIMRKDMRTLTNLNWLNDEIINAYFHLIVVRGQEPKRKKAYAFNTFFYPKLRDSGYSSVKRWTRKVDVFSYDYLLIPVHLGNHWCLAFVDMGVKKICYYDSLGGSPNGCCDILLDYLRNESNDKKKQDLDDENWRSFNAYHDIGIPQQMNGSDCGVFACQFAEHLTRPAKLNFTQDHMQYFRKKMIYELLTKRILE